MNEEATLTIGDVARRTGVAVPTLRMWEARFGFPRPARSQRGHRRYSDGDCALVLEVVRGRGDGLSLPAAIARVRRRLERPESSIFAGLRRRHADLVPAEFPKPVMLALTRAIEDECYARAERALLFGSFQRERFYRASERRWRELARTAGLALVFADFRALRSPAGGPHEVPLDGASPSLREWAIVCVAPSFAACLAGWERPVADRGRVFETIWTVDPAVVHDAARIYVGLASERAPDVASTAATRLVEALPPPSDAVRNAMALTSRMVTYVTGAGGGGRALARVTMAPGGKAPSDAPLSRGSCPPPRDARA